MKLRKIITMGLAAIMAVSAMSISAFANNVDNNAVTLDDYQRVVDKINQEYGEDFYVEWSEDITLTAEELSKFETFLREEAEMQIVMNEKAQAADKQEQIELLTEDMISPLVSARATSSYSLTHTVGIVPINARGQYTTGTNKRFSTCSGVNASFTNAWIGAGFAQDSYSANIIDAKRTLSVSVTGAYRVTDEYGTYYNPSATFSTEFYYTEL